MKIKTLKDWMPRMEVSPKPILRAVIPLIAPENIRRDATRGLETSKYVANLLSINWILLPPT